MLEIFYIFVVNQTSVMSSKVMAACEIKDVMKVVVKTQLHIVMSILNKLPRNRVVKFLNSLNDQNGELHTTDTKYHYKSDDDRIYIGNAMMSVLRPADRDEFPLFYETVFNTFADQQYELYDGYLYPKDDIKPISGAKTPTEEELERFGDKFLAPGIKLFIKMIDTVMSKHSHNMVGIYRNISTAIEYGHVIKSVNHPQTFNYGIKSVEMDLPFLSMFNGQLLNDGWISKYSRTKLCDGTGITISVSSKEVLVIKKEKLENVPKTLLQCSISGNTTNLPDDAPDLPDKSVNDNADSSSDESTNAPDLPDKASSSDESTNAPDLPSSNKSVDDETELLIGNDESNPKYKDWSDDGLDSQK